MKSTWHSADSTPMTNAHATEADAGQAPDQPHTP